MQLRTEMQLSFLLVVLYVYVWTGQGSHFVLFKWVQMHLKEMIVQRNKMETIQMIPVVPS